MAANLAILITARNQTQGAFSEVSSGLTGLAKVVTAPIQAIGGIASAIGGIGIAAAGLSSIGGTISAAFEGAKQSEINVSQLNAVLQSTHGIAGITSQAAQSRR